VNSLEAQNNEYRKAIPRLEECLKGVGVALDALQKHWNWLEVQFGRSPRIERSLNKHWTK
jgi:hypothetical protein